MEGWYRLLQIDGKCRYSEIGHYKIKQLCYRLNGSNLATIWFAHLYIKCLYLSTCLDNVVYNCEYVG